MIWQLLRAKKLTAFKQYIQQELKTQVINHLKAQLTEQRCELLPNKACHIEASIYFWTLANVRILQYALENELLSKQWLTERGHKRHCQHLFHVEAEYALPDNRIKPPLITY